MRAQFSKEGKLRDWQNSSLLEETGLTKPPFKTVITEYFEEFDESGTRKIHTITRAEEWVGSAHDPVRSYTSTIL